jgi:L-alanine-DL-glutamate epimerase-like enolase superfamily enzyme
MSEPGTWWQRLSSIVDLLPDGLPAARFGLETAALDLACAQAGCSPFQLLETSPHASLSVNGLLHDLSLCTPEQALLQLSKLNRNTLKLKLGNQPVRVLDVLNRLRAKPGIRLRCDANRSLDAASLRELLPALATLGLEFLEEPCVPPLWPSLPKVRPPLALDESLIGVEASDLPRLVARSKASVLVLKPMALGGFTKCRALAAAGAESGMGIVVTHLFDGPIALQAASALALMVHTPQLAAGLAAHGGLKAWDHIVEYASADHPRAVSFERRLISLDVHLPEEK